MILKNNTSSHDGRLACLLILAIGLAVLPYSVQVQAQGDFNSNQGFNSNQVRGPKTKSESPGYDWTANDLQQLVDQHPGLIKSLLLQAFFHTPSDDREQAELKQNAERALQTLGAVATPHFITILDDQENVDLLRGAAAKYMGLASAYEDFPTANAVAALVQAIERDDQPSVVLIAQQSLAQVIRTTRAAARAELRQQIEARLDLEHLRINRLGDHRQYPPGGLVFPVRWLGVDGGSRPIPAMVIIPKDADRRYLRLRLLPTVDGVFRIDRRWVGDGDIDIIIGRALEHSTGNSENDDAEANERP